MTELIPLPHFRQSAEGYCLPACVRMVLSSLGINLSEIEISRILGTRDFGTPSFAVTRLGQLGVQVSYKEWSVAQLFTKLGEGSPVIVFVQTAFLDHWTLDVAHALVVVGTADDERFLVHDPALPTGPISVSQDGLIAGWAEFSYRGATITRQ